MDATALHAARGGTVPRSTFAFRLGALIAVGLAVRVVIALLTHGQPYDMNSVRIVREDLAAHGFHIYRYVNVGNWHWPYPPAFFPWIALSGAIAGAHSHVFEVLIRLPTILADAALAWVVQEYLRLRGASEASRLVAASVVLLGPVFVAVAGYHGQMDSLAILPAAAAVLVWERMDGERRALVAGALIGLGGALKTVPLLMVLALAPSVRSWRELAKLALSAAAVPVALLIPFAIATPGLPEAALRKYHGFPGQGGLSLVLQPDLAKTWLMGVHNHPPHFSGLSRALGEHASIVNYAIFGATAAFLARHRPSPPLAACVLWLALFAFAPSFFFQYLIWGLPFLLMAGYRRSAAALQLAVLVPMLLFYFGPSSAEWPAYVYIPIMLAVWGGTVVGLIAAGRRVRAGGA